METAKPYRLWGDEGIDIFVRLSPKSAKDSVEGIEVTADGRVHLKARVRAVPEKGKANQALIILLSKTLEVPASRLAVVSGETARLKTLRISSDDAQALVAVLDSFAQSN